MEIADHQKIFTCSKCNVPFDNQYDRNVHQKICLDSVLLEKPENITKSIYMSYRELLEQTASKEPFYRRYLNRIHYGEPNSMIEIYDPKRRRSTL